MVQGKLSYVSPLQWLTPDAKLTLSTSGLWQRQQADCSQGDFLDADGTCDLFFNGTALNADAHADVWAVDGFAMLDAWGWNFVAYGYTGKGVGTTGLMWDGIDVLGERRRSDGGYVQAAYTFAGGWFLPNPLTVGASWGISHLETASASDQFVVDTECGVFTSTPGLGVSNCLVRDNESWIGFARYKLTKWVNLQAEYTHTIDENQLGQRLFDNAVAVGATFFW
jgi:hypothetical protein